MGYFKNYQSIDNKTESGDSSKQKNMTDSTNNNDSGTNSDPPNNNHRRRRHLWNHLNPESNNHIEPMPELNPREERIYQQLQKIQHVMDDAFAVPCTCGYYRTGLDPIIGLLPIVGDFASAIVSLTLVARAAPVLNKYTTTRMLINVGIDASIGVIPIVGDAFDFGFKANSRNLAIFEDHMKHGITQRGNIDKCYVCSVVAAVILWFVSFAIISILLLVYLILWLTGHLPSS